jgi:hypothetical protein
VEPFKWVKFEIGDKRSGQIKIGSVMHPSGVVPNEKRFIGLTASPPSEAPLKDNDRFGGAELVCTEGMHQF